MQTFRDVYGLDVRLMEYNKFIRIPCSFEHNLETIIQNYAEINPLNQIAVKSNSGLSQ